MAPICWRYVAKYGYKPAIEYGMYVLNGKGLSVSWGPTIGASTRAMQVAWDILIKIRTHHLAGDRHVCILFLKIYITYLNRILCVWVYKILENINFGFN